MRAYERFLNYVKVFTTSDETSDTVPTTNGQRVLANILVDELKSIGVPEVEVDEKGYLYATLPATAGLENLEAIGFIAHLDTAPDAKGEGVNPVIHENYSGEDIKLGDIVLSSKMFPHLTTLKGKTLITTDGTTLLGADDKAGVAEIITVVERLITENIPHRKVCVAFTPDEEVGRGADHFNVEKFGVPYAYTVDGSEPGIIEYETFNGAAAKLTIKGVSVHPGSAKNVMKNAAQIGCEIAAMLPENETPATTDGYEGFYHLINFSGATEEAVLDYIIRDHDKTKFEARKAKVQEVVDTVNKKYGDVVTAEIKDSYYNMADKITPCFFIVDKAIAATKAVGLEAKCEPIRGGTDGSKLSFMGLPCPNLPTGGRAFHGPYEHITVEDMDICCETILNIITAV